MITLSVKKTLIGADGPFDLSVDLSVNQGELLSLFGVSGSGKTMLLRIVAGLEKPDEGVVEVHGKTWFDSRRGIHWAPQKRSIGFVFQDYSLFPTMTVYENLRYAQSRRNEAKISDILELTGLFELKDRLPATLSGGQKQRVALARAIIREPDILLLDEPLSALDMKTRSKLQNEILSIHRALGLTTILVSHDKHEVFKLSDTVAVIERGKILRRGKTLDVFFDRAASNKFSFVSHILSIRKVDAVYLAVIGAGNELVEVVLCESDLKELNVGDEVLVASKAFNPIVQKI
jgi:molybdate transport system ATP-binding protein